GSDRGAVGSAAGAGTQQRRHRGRGPSGAGLEDRRHREDPALRAQPRGPLQIPRRRPQRAETGLRLHQARRGRRHRAPRRSGDTLALRAKSQGATGVITDGGVRDSAEVAGILPVFATAKNPAVLGRRHVPWESDVAVACGNATVLPGDVIVADDDGAIVIPRDLAEEVVDTALATEPEAGGVAEQVAAGHPIEGLFPPKGEWKAKFEDWKASR